jgi:hypothetical protein
LTVLEVSETCCTISFSALNAMYFIRLHFLVHKIFTIYINGVLKFKRPALGPCHEDIKKREGKAPYILNLSIRWR